MRIRPTTPWWAIALGATVGIVLLAAILRFGRLCNTPLENLLWYCSGSSTVELPPAVVCGRACESADDCPAELYCRFNDSGPGHCAGEVCDSSVATCDGPDSVWADGTRHLSVASCAVPAGLCSCSGTSLSCPPDVTSSISMLCYPPGVGCGCSGPDEVCTFGGVTRVSQRNAPQCQAALPQTSCFQACDPAAPRCDAGLSCTQTQDGLYRCMGGVDSSGYDCTTWPTFAGCNQYCDPAAPRCDPGLTCLTLGEGSRCVGGVDSDGVDCSAMVGRVCTTGELVAPVQVSPPDGSTVNVLRPELVWTFPGSCTPYDSNLEMQPDGEAAFGFVGGFAMHRTTLVPLEDCRQYSWRVMATSGGGDGGGSWSPWWSFRVDLTGSCGFPTPTALVPASGSRSTTTQEPLLTPAITEVVTQSPLEGADGTLCGDGICQAGEGPNWCGDCAPTGGDKKNGGGGKPAPVCGDGVCDESEKACGVCSADCGPC